MNKVKFNFTLDIDVARYIMNIDAGERSKAVNAILKGYINKEKTGESRQPLKKIKSRIKKGSKKSSVKGDVAQVDA